MLKVNKKKVLLSSLFEESFQSYPYVQKSKSTSRRKSSSYKSMNGARKSDFLSFSRTPSVLSSQKISKPIKLTKRQPPSLHSMCASINNKFATVGKEDFQLFYNECNNAMQELINLNHPISGILNNIKLGYDQKLAEKDNELKRYQKLQISEKTNNKTRNIDFCSTNTGYSIFKRIKKRSISRKKIQIFDSPEDAANSKSIPKLNIKKITIAKQGSSEKITNTRDETSKNYLFQDYQDEFMSKFDEFSES